MDRQGRTFRRGIAVLTAAAACVIGAMVPGTASAQSGLPYINWPALLPAFPGVPFTPNLEPECVDGSDACIDRTIIEMKRRLNTVVGTCSHNAVFSLAYLRVTEDVRKASLEGLFADRVWLAREDAVFARMYFEAYDRWASGARDRVPQSWLLAFDAARDRKVNGLGNFLMSMNAHINRDMPMMIAAVGVTQEDGTTRKPDHDAYNPRLAALYQPVLKEVADRFDPSADDIELGPVDDLIAGAILAEWREGVWRNAERLVSAPTPEARAEVQREIELYANGAAEVLRSTFAADPAERDAWCAEHGGQVPAGAAGSDGDVAQPVGPGAARVAAPGRRSAAARLVRSRSGGGVLRVPLRCGRATTGCRGTVTVRGGRATYALPAGGVRTVQVALTRGDTRAIARRGRAVVTIRRASVASSRATVRVAVRVLRAKEVRDDAEGP